MSQNTKQSSGVALVGANGMMNQVAFPLHLLWEPISVEGCARMGLIYGASAHKGSMDPTVSMI